jgi:hypothetical protein
MKGVIRAYRFGVELVRKPDGNDSARRQNHTPETVSKADLRYQRRRGRMKAVVNDAGLLRTVFRPLMPVSSYKENPGSCRLALDIAGERIEQQQAIPAANSRPTTCAKPP